MGISLSITSVLFVRIYIVINVKAMFNLVSFVRSAMVDFHQPAFYAVNLIVPIAMEITLFVHHAIMVIILMAEIATNAKPIVYNVPQTLFAINATVYRIYSRMADARHSLLTVLR